VSKSSGSNKPKTDGTTIPARPPACLTTTWEKAAWKRVFEALKKSALPQGCDVEAAILCARRLATVEELRELTNGLKPDERFTRGGNGQLTAHPAYLMLARAERDLLASYRSLLMTTGTRSSSRLSAEAMEQEIPNLGTDGKPSSVSLR